MWEIYFSFIKFFMHSICIKQLMALDSSIGSCYVYTSYNLSYLCDPACNSCNNVARAHSAGQII